MSLGLGLPFPGFRAQVLGMGTSYSPDTRLTREVLVRVVWDGPRGLPRMTLVSVLGMIGLVVSGVSDVHVCRSNATILVYANSLLFLCKCSILMHAYVLLCLKSFPLF